MEVYHIKIRGSSQRFGDRRVGVVLECICIATGHEFGEARIGNWTKLSFSFTVCCGKKCYTVPLLHQLVHEKFYKQLNSPVSRRRNASPERRHLRDTKMS